MLVRKVTASAKGQFTLPADIVRQLGGGKGPIELILVQDGRRVVLLPAEDAGQAIMDDLAGWDMMAARSLDQLWDNEFDEVWDDV